MCLAIPGKVKKIEGQKAEIDYGSEIRHAFLAGEPVKVGDFVMVQMGVIVKILTAQEAKVARDAWKT